MPAAPDCATELRKIYDAIMALSTGDRVTGINFGERSAQYSQSDLPALQKLFSTFYRQCGADSGLVNLSAANMVQRGPPAIIPR